jgi:hypothetical protein
MKPDHIIAIDKQRMEGLSAGEVLAALVKAHGEQNGAAMFKQYAKTPMPDGRPRSQVNLGDPTEWGTGD